MRKDNAGLGWGFYVLLPNYAKTASTGFKAAEEVKDAKNKLDKMEGIRFPTQ